jgi:hypothetical protein
MLLNFEKKEKQLRVKAKNSKRSRDRYYKEGGEGGRVHSVLGPEALRYFGWSVANENLEELMQVRRLIKQ